MGQKISQMNQNHFLKGGFGGQTELIELAIDFDDTLTTASADAENIASLAAPFRFYINESSSLSIEDDTDAVVTIAKIPMREAARELIRIGQVSEYDPNDPNTFPIFNAFSGASLRFNLLFKIYWNDGTGSIINSTTLACDVVGSPTDGWIISGLNGNGDFLVGQTLPQPYPLDEYNVPLWPSEILMEYDGLEQFIIIKARVNLGSLDILTIRTLGSIDGVFFLQQLF